MNKKKRVAGYAGAVLSAVIFGCVPLFVVNIYDRGISPTFLVAIRSGGVALVAMLAALFRKQSFYVGWKPAANVAVLAFWGVGLTASVLYLSYQNLDTSIATSIHYLYPVIVLFGEMLLFRNKLHFRSVLCALLCFAGVAAFCNTSGYVTPRGMLQAILSAFTYAAYIIYFDKAKPLQFMDHSVYLCYYNFFGLIITACMIIFGKVPVVDAAAVSGDLWIYLIAIILLVGFMGGITFQIGMRHLGCVRVSFISTLEPLTSIAVGALFLRENVTLLTLLGAALILAAVMLTIVNPDKKRVP